MAWADELVKFRRTRRAFIRLAQELNPQATNWTGALDRRWGKTHDHKGTIPHPGTVENFGQFNNALANFEFPIELPSISTTLIDKNNEWRALAARPSQNLLRRKIGYYLRQESDLEEIFDQLIAIGRVKTSSFPPGKVTLSLDIPGGDSLGAVLGRRRVNAADFPRALPENIDAVVPFVYGHLTNGTVPVIVTEPPEEEPPPEEGGCLATNLGDPTGVVVYQTAFAAGASEWPNAVSWGRAPAFPGDPTTPSAGYPDDLYPEIRQTRGTIFAAGVGPGGENAMTPSLANTASTRNSAMVISPVVTGSETIPGTNGTVVNVGSWDARSNRLTFNIRFSSTYIAQCIANGTSDGASSAFARVFCTKCWHDTVITTGGDPGVQLQINFSAATFGPTAGIFGDNTLGAYWLLHGFNGNPSTSPTYLRIPLDTWLTFQIDWRCASSPLGTDGIARWMYGVGGSADTTVIQHECAQIIVNPTLNSRTREEYYTAVGGNGTYSSITNADYNFGSFLVFGMAPTGGKVLGDITNIRLEQLSMETPPPPDEEPPPEEEPPAPVSTCDTPDDQGAAQRGGWLRALLVDTGGGATDITGVAVPTGLSGVVLEIGDPAPSLSGALAAGGEANTGFSYYYAIASIRNGVFSQLSNIVGPLSPTSTQRVDLSWGALSPTPDLIRVYRAQNPDFFQSDQRSVDLAGTATSVTDFFPGYSHRGYPPSGTDPGWDVNYPQTNYYQITALTADGESACSAFEQVNLYPRNSPQTVRVTWNPVAGATSYRVRRYRQFYSFEMGATAQFVVGGSGTSVDDPNTGDSVVSNCPTEAIGGASITPRYLLAGHCLRAINEVFVNRPDPETGEFVQTLMVEGTNYVQVIVEINGNRYHCIDFLNEADIRSDSCQYYEVTANVDGATYNAEVGGVLIEDIVDIVEHIFMNVIFNTYRSSIGPYAPPGGIWFTDTSYSPGLINHPSFVDAKAASARKLAGGRLGAGALVEKIDARQLIHDLLVSSGLDLYQYLGSWYVKMFEPNLVARAALARIDPTSTIIKETFEPTVDDSKMVNIIPFFAGPLGGFSNSGYLVSGERRDPVSIADYGEMISEPFYLIWTHDPATAVSVIVDYLQQWSTPLMGAQFTAPVGWYLTRPTAEVRVTSKEGFGTLGWVDQVCRVLAVDLDIDSLLAKFTIRDINALVP